MLSILLWIRVHAASQVYIIGEKQNMCVGGTRLWDILCYDRVGLFLYDCALKS